MDLLNELEQLIKNYKNSKNNHYTKFIDLCEEIHSKHLEVQPGIIMILPKKWEEDLIFALKIIPNKDPIYSDVQNPYGILDMVMFFDVKEPKIYEKVPYESK